MSQPDPVVPNTAPLAPEQAASLNSLLKGLQADQLLWIEGFISGLRAGSGVGSSEVAAPSEAPALTVLYGTESGNSESLADLTVKAANTIGFKAKAVNMADIKVAKLRDIENLLVIVSTWGEGDPPETAADFYQDFMAENAPRLVNTRFSVLGLGDTSYEEFCKMGKDFDARLEALGARRIYERVDCDVDYDDDFDKWRETKADSIGMSGLLVKSVTVMEQNLRAFNELGISVPVILDLTVMGYRIEIDGCSQDLTRRYM